MSRSKKDVLTQFEAGLVPNQISGVEEFYASLPPEEQRPELISDLARAELYFCNWRTSRLAQILKFANEVDPDGPTCKSILEGVYADRVECGENPSLDEFQDFDLSLVSLRGRDDPFALGDHCGDFLINRRLGAGAFGVVFEGKSPTGHRVAIKSPFRTRNEARAALHNELLRAEANAAQLLSGRFFPRFVGWIEEKGRSSLLTVLIEGQSLKAILKSQPLDPKIAASIVADVAEALFHAHTKGLIHRDVKPANVMVRDDGSAVVLDFGFAVDDEQVIDLEGQVAGTLGHQSPDAILGNVPDMDARSDVWALGPLLYECLTGRSLFNPDGVEDALTSAIVAAVLPKDDSSVPDELNLVILKCVQANPIGRYDTALEVSHDLRRFIDPSTPTQPVDRIPLLAFRIGRELGEAQCHVDAFNHYFEAAPYDSDALRFAVGSLFMVSEEIRHTRIQLGKLVTDYREWPSFEHDVISRLFYTSSKLTSEDLPALEAASQTAMRWLEDTCTQVQEFLCQEPKSTRAIFELGVAATLPKSIMSRQIRIKGLAELAELPQDIWTQFNEFLDGKCPSSFVNDEWRRFSKRVERFYLYGAGRPDLESS